LPVKKLFLPLHPVNRKSHAKENISALTEEKTQQTWIHGAHVDCQRTENIGQAQGKGQEKDVCQR
jgi:hypothetical protein